MKLSRFFPLLLLISTLAASAQLAPYAEFGAAKLNVPSTDWIYGPTVGAYYDHGHLIFLNSGIDVRGQFLGGSGSTQMQSGLVGPRLAITPHVLPIMPYVEGLIGVAHAVYTQQLPLYAQPLPCPSNVFSCGSPTPTQATVDETRMQYDVIGGIDFTVLPRIDWRMVEFGYGGVFGPGSPGSSFTSAYPGVVTGFNTKTLSTGIVIRLP